MAGPDSLLPQLRVCRARHLARAGSATPDGVRAANTVRPVLLLLDQASSHTAQRSQALAAQLDIRLLWLPKQRPELNAMDPVWRELKLHISANRQYPSVGAQVDAAVLWVLSLTPTQALRKVGILAEAANSTARRRRWARATASRESPSYSPRS
ncbi:transposase [Myxococcus sp. AB036A]|uniref:transposase n=1 Tax=Myxococcus sp. AB036A TaxID=2562793 RepID=UPI001E28E693